MEPDEGLEKLTEADKICKLYSRTFYDRKVNLAHYFKERPVVEWDFKPSLVFFRLDILLKQLKQSEVCGIIMHCWYHTSCVG